MRTACASALLFALGLASCDFEEERRDVPLGLRVVLASGEVTASDGRSTRRLVGGEMLPAALELRVGSWGRAVARLASGSTIVLRENTAIRFEKGEIALLRGEFWFSGARTFARMERVRFEEMAVASAAAEFDFLRTGDRAEVYVADGRVLVAAPTGRVEATVGERVIVDSRGRPRVEPVAFWRDWTAGMAGRRAAALAETGASGRLFGVDPSVAGAAPEELRTRVHKVNAVVREGIAVTTVEQVFFNPGFHDLEGWYWFTVPEGAAVTRFALEEDGRLVEGVCVERRAAATAYEAAVARDQDPAILEWIDGQTYRARIYPVPSLGARRVVLAYSERLPLSGGRYRYRYPVAEAAKEVDDFSFEVDLGELGTRSTVFAFEGARVDNGGARVQMRRSGYAPRADFLIEIAPLERPSPLRVVRSRGPGDEPDFVAIRYAPDVAFEGQKDGPARVVAIVDTSAADADRDMSIKLSALEALLRALGPEDVFAVIAADVFARCAYPTSGFARVEESEIAAALSAVSQIPPDGATDLGAAWKVAAELSGDGAATAIVYIGDGRATVGETTATALRDRLRGALSGSQARFFALAVGAHANVPLLEHLARSGGGRARQIRERASLATEALALAGELRKPVLAQLSVDVVGALDQVLASDAELLSRGEEMLVVGRVRGALPDVVTVRGVVGKEKRVETYDASPREEAVPGEAASLWAGMKLARLLEQGAGAHRGEIVALGLEHRMMTPFTSLFVDPASGAEAREDGQSGRRDASHKDQRFAIKGPPESRDVEMGTKMAPLEFRSSPQPTADRDPRMASEMMAKEAGTLEYVTAGKVPISPLRAPDSLVFELRDWSVIGTGRGGGASSGDNASSGDGGSVIAAQTAVIAVSSPAPSVASWFKLKVCSDASRRPLPERRILWRHRLKLVAPSSDWLRVFNDAGERCELKSYEELQALLDEIEALTRTELDVVSLLHAFRPYPGARWYLQRRVARRVASADMAFDLWNDDGFDWEKARSGLAALPTVEQKLQALAPILRGRPFDGAGRTLEASLLARAGRREEALAKIAQIERDGLGNPELFALLCELRAGDRDALAAQRVCSRLVEFAPDDPGARQRLGDLYMRFGFYGAAYRQYATLARMYPAPHTALRLAAAAAGEGRIDEALRLERAVSESAAEPGENDPRMAARLASAARLAKLVIDEESSGRDVKEPVLALVTALRQSGALPERGRVALLQWEDLEMRLEIAAPKPKRPTEEVPGAGDAIAGIAAADLSAVPRGDSPVAVAVRGKDLRRDVPCALIEIETTGDTIALREFRGAVRGGALVVDSVRSAVVANR